MTKTFDVKQFAQKIKTVTAARTENNLCDSRIRVKLLLRIMSTTSLKHTIENLLKTLREKTF